MNLALSEWIQDAGSWLGNAWDHIFGMTASAWAASAGWATAAIALGATSFAAIQVKEARKTREEQAQPNVVMFAEPNYTHWHAFEIVVKNFGSTPAFNIRLHFDQVPQVSRNGGPEAEVTDLWIPEVIPVLAPQQEWRNSLGLFHKAIQARLTVVSRGLCHVSGRPGCH